MSQRKIYDDIEKWSQDLLEKTKNEQRKNQFQAWGKLGGRPRKGDEKKTEKILLSLTKMQKEKLKKVSASYGISPQDWLRYLILNNEPRDAERNKILMSYHTNFKRISNHFKSGVWSYPEREKFKYELEKVILLIKNEIKK